MLFICIGNCTHRPVIISKRSGGTYYVINNITFLWWAVALLPILYSTHCYFLYSSMYNDKAYHKNCIVAVILSHTHLSVCNVMLTLRASPRATPPLSPISLTSILCLDNMKAINFIPLNTQLSHALNNKIIIKNVWLVPHVRSHEI